MFTVRVFAPLAAAGAIAGFVLSSAGPQSPRREAVQSPRCASDNGGLTLAGGFCALLVGERLGDVRHLVVAPEGDIYAAVEGSGGGVLALRDTDGDGQADLRKRFGPSGATGIGLAGEYLYLATQDRVLRWRRAPGELVPAGDFETVVRGLPGGGDHYSKSLALGPGGALYVSIGSASNSCQQRNRKRRSPGIDPCGELTSRAGIWRFSADRLDQRPGDGVRFATGLRNAVGLAAGPESGKLFATVHGRDQLGDNWGFTDEQNAELPAEELVQVNEGDDFGWPYCYYDQQAGRLVLAPEYGGDGKASGQCTGKKDPLTGFPGHWAPMDLAFYTGSQFPGSYRGGAFIAFHGSWNRAPLPEAGYRVVFVPFNNGTPSGGYSTFATSTRGPTDLRASGVAVGPDGSLYIAADDNGKIWRVMLKR